MQRPGFALRWSSLLVVGRRLRRCRSWRCRCRRRGRCRSGRGRCRSGRGRCSRLCTRTHRLGVVAVSIVRIDTRAGCLRVWAGRSASSTKHAASHAGAWSARAWSASPRPNGVGSLLLRDLRRSAYSPRPAAIPMQPSRYLVLGALGAVCPAGVHRTATLYREPLRLLSTHRVAGPAATTTAPSAAASAP
jgi:hypothetical protein